MYYKQMIGVGYFFKMTLLKKNIITVIFKYVLSVSGVSIIDFNRLSIKHFERCNNQLWIMHNQLSQKCWWPIKYIESCVSSFLIFISSQNPLKLPLHACKFHSFLFCFKTWLTSSTPFCIHLISKKIIFFVLLHISP